MCVLRFPFVLYERLQPSTVHEKALFSALILKSQVQANTTGFSQKKRGWRKNWTTTVKQISGLKKMVFCFDFRPSSYLRMSHETLTLGGKSVLGTCWIKGTYRDKTWEKIRALEPPSFLDPPTFHELRPKYRPLPLCPAVILSVRKVARWEDLKFIAQRSKLSSHLEEKQTTKSVDLFLFLCISYVFMMLLDDTSTLFTDQVQTNKHAHDTFHTIFWY